MVGSRPNLGELAPTGGVPLRIGDPVVGSVLRSGEPDPGEIAALHTWAEDVEIDYRAASFDASVATAAEGYRIEALAGSLVRDPTLLLD